MKKTAFVLLALSVCNAISAAVVQAREPGVKPSEAPKGLPAILPKDVVNAWDIVQRDGGDIEERTTWVPSPACVSSSAQKVSLFS
jgi:hypothetical protein